MVSQVQVYLFKSQFLFNSAFIVQYELFSRFSMRHFSSSQSESSKNTLHEADLTQEERFNQILTQADQLIQNEEIQQGVERLRLLSQKINFWKQNKREYDRKLELVCIYNLAAAHQKQWNLGQCIPLMQKFISITKICLQENLKSSGTINFQELNTNKHWFKLKTVQVKAMLQYCAALSQIGEHKKAFKIVIQITNQLKNLFRRGMDQCSKQIAKRQANQSKKTIAKEGKGGTDKIQFSFSMLLSARQILQVLMNMQTYSDIIERNSIQSEMQQVKSKIYYWKSNPQNNIKTLRQSFGIPVEQPEQVRRQNDRNLLGIKRGQNWIEQFTIAKIMFMTPLNYLQFSENDNLIFQFNNRNLVQKIILLSVAYFSLSIQLRFLEEQGEHNHLTVKNSKAQKKKEGQNSLKQLQNSEIFHLKSIQIVCKHIKQNSAFINHLVNNYHKHYQNNLNIIQQQNSLAQYSELYDPKKRIISNLQAESQIELQSNNNLNIPSKTSYRKDSIYYQDQLQVRDKKQVSLQTSFSKKNKKFLTQLQQDKTQKSNKLASSTSFTRIQDIGPRDKTAKKVRVAHMVTVGKLQLQQLQKQDKSQKQISSKIMSSKSIKEKSLSKNKNFLKNSVTLKQNKSASPIKERSSKQKNLRDLKQSVQLKRDFAKKKSPETSRALDLLKKSGSLYEFTGKSLKQSGSIYTSSHGLHNKKKY